MARVTLPHMEAEPMMPCCPGDKPKSALMEGRSIPTVDITMNPDTLAKSQIPMTIQR
jgi:hypothetical protein